MNIINELAQWTVLVASLVVALAVLRQFGLQQLGSRTYFEESFGPQVGSAFVEDGVNRLLDPGALEALPGSAHHILIFIKEGCPLCADFVSATEMKLQQSGRRPSLSFVVDAEGDEFLDSIRLRLAGLVVEDLRRAITDFEERPKAYPFAIALDSNGVVVEKHIGSSGIRFITEAFEESPAARR